MKKLIFLLLVFLIGFGVVFAGTILEQPPGVTTEVASPMTEYSFHEGVVTQSAVLGVISLPSVDPSSFQAVMANDNYNIAVQPYSGFMKMLGVNTGQYWNTDSRRRLLYNLRL
jgi:hypothetical protein